MIIVAYYTLTTHENMGNGTKLDEARQRQKDRVLNLCPVRGHRMRRRLLSSRAAAAEQLTLQ